MRLFFTKGEERRHIGTFDTDEQALSAIHEFCTQRNFQIPYFRSWEIDGVRHYDVGSHTEFFELELRNSAGWKAKSKVRWNIWNWLRSSILVGVKKGGIQK